MKYLPEEEKLYTGGKVNWKSEERVKAKKALRSEVEDLLRPQENKTFLGLRIGLWSYYKNQEEKPGIIAKFIYRKYGEEPVYLSDLESERTISLIHNRLENRGYFFASVDQEVKEKNQTASAVYSVHLPAPYRLETYQYYGDTTRFLEKEIEFIMHQKPLLKIGDRYDLDKLKAERERIDPELKNRGFYYFNPDFLLFRVDTNQYAHKGFDLFLSLKPETPREALFPYKIDEVIVFPDYQVTDENMENKRDSIIVDGISFVQSEEAFKPNLLRNYILFKPGDIYSRHVQNRTITRISNIGNFRFVNIRFYPKDTIQTDKEGYGSLGAGIYLSPFNKRSLRLEMQALSKSNNFVGPNLLISYRNRNIFRGAESLSISGKFGFETQFAGGQRTGLNSFEFGLESELLYPRMVVPFRIKPGFGYSVPKTRISLSYSILERVNLYRLNSLVGSFGYQWISSRYTSHEIFPVSLNYLKASRISPRFEEVLQANSFLRRSFDQQYIAGLIYSFQFSQLVNQEKTHRFFTRFNLDMSGHTLTLFSNLGTGSGSDDFLGEKFAYYSRFDIDLRHYLRINNSNRFITRAFAGAGFSHGNTQTIPYIKQYASGGPNSIRAFRIRSLGPGAYHPVEVGLSSFFDQSGDVKLEGNLEYRFPIVWFLNGALFADAGNVWLLKENVDLPGSRFTSDWTNQLAFGAGFGIRLDFDFFVVRLDLATPLHDPSKEVDKWQRSFNLLQKDWRRNYLVWNFAIGYPF